MTTDRCEYIYKCPEPTCLKDHCQHEVEWVGQQKAAEQAGETPIGYFFRQNVVQIGRVVMMNVDHLPVFVRWPLCMENLLMGADGVTFITVAELAGIARDVAADAIAQQEATEIPDGVPAEWTGQGSNN